VVGLYFLEKYSQFTATRIWVNTQGDSMRWISHVNRITAEQPTEQIWKLLRLFLDSDATAVRYANFVDIGDEEYEKKKENIFKQVKQIGYCIRQAEEYFRAGSQVSLATRPLLLYYGAVSLSQALVLLKNDGEKSFDFKKSEKDIQVDPEVPNRTKLKPHEHHGLELKKDFVSVINRRSLTPKDFFDSISCEVYINKEDKPWGQFPNFHNSLEFPAYEVNATIHERWRSKPFMSKVCNLTQIFSLQELVDKKSIKVLGLLRLLPDLVGIMNELELGSILTRGTLTINSRIFRGPMVETNYIYEFDEGINNYQFFREFFQRQVQATIETDIPDPLQAKLHQIEGPFPHELVSLLPAIDDISGNLFFYSQERVVSEIDSIHMILFCLGMLSRYHPHVWMKVITEHVVIAELIDSFLNVVIRKFPNLILDQMTLTKNQIRQFI
jgi:YaaC-like Protein